MQALGRISCTCRRPGQAQHDSWLQSHFREAGSACRTSSRSPWSAWQGRLPRWSPRRYDVGSQPLQGGQARPWRRFAAAATQDKYVCAGARRRQRPDKFVEQPQVRILFSDFLAVMYLLSNLSPALGQTPPLTMATASAHSPSAARSRTAPLFRTGLIKVGRTCGFGRRSHADLRNLSACSRSQDHG